MERMSPAHKYEFRRRLRHFHKVDTPIFGTFCKLTRESFPPQVRHVVLKHCMHEHDKRIDLHVVVVMPDHEHPLFIPLRDDDGWPHPVYKIMKAIEGMSARDVNKLTGTGGPVWQDGSLDHVLRSDESLKEKTEYIRMNPVRKELAQVPEGYKWLWFSQDSVVATETELTSCGERRGQESPRHLTLDVFEKTKRPRSVKNVAFNLMPATTYSPTSHVQERWPGYIK